MKKIINLFACQNKIAQKELNKQKDEMMVQMTAIL